jgi:hypothetical protein
MHRHGSHSGTLWVPITYGDFWDVPRTVIIKFSDKTIFLDCAFDDDLDDYPESYKVYELDDDASANPGQIAWADYSNHGKLIGTLAVADTEFDSTKRKSIDASVFHHITPIE